LMQPDDRGKTVIGADEPLAAQPEHAALVAIGSNLILTIFKFLLASLTGSLALLAEAFHSFSDIGSSLMVFLVLRAERVNDRRSQLVFSWLPGWNPQRMAALLIGLFLVVVAGSIFSKVFSPAPLSLAYPVPVALALLALALLSFLLSRFEQFVGEKHDSTALVADGLHARVDMFGTLLVSLALLGESVSLAVDRLAAGVISLLILAQAIQVFVTVARDYVSKEQKELYLYPRFLLELSRGTYPRVRRSVYDWVGARIRIAPDAPELDRQVGRALLVAGSAILIAGYVATGLFKVEAYQQAMVERFGRPLEPHALGPGLHYRLPWPVDRARKVDTDRVMRLVVGSEIVPDSQVLLWTNLHYIQEFNVLSAENIFMDVSLIVEYRIGDAYAYLYSARSPELVLREIAYEVLVHAMAERFFFQLVTAERDEVEKLILGRIETELTPLSSGLKLMSVNLRDLHPPTAVALEFEDVVGATIDYETYINEARGYSNELLPRARGQAEVMVAQATARRKSTRLRGQGESARFLAVWGECSKEPQLCRRRLLLETLETTLAGKEKYIVPPEAVDGAIDLFLIADTPETERSGDEAAAALPATRR
jgi:membrane protease subunit HflK